VALTRNIWVVYTGGILGLIFMRFAASWFIKLLERFPLLEHSAYLVIGWIAVKLGLEAAANWQASIGGAWHFKLHSLLFWSVTFILFGLGFLRKAKPESKSVEPTGDDSGDSAPKAG
jgi:predicted tellurium resistance membrane protein TerC